MHDTPRKELSPTGTVFEIKRFAVHDGDGIRTTVFLKGCPLCCAWCHNPEGLSRKVELAYYESKCIVCGECIVACPNAAHSLTDRGHLLRRDLCTACGKCAEACLGDALKCFGKKVTPKELLPILLEDRAFYASSGGGVTLSGGECLLQADFCAALLKLLKENGIHTAVDTCGFVSREAIDKVMPLTDVFLYDVKGIDETVHIRCTGQSNQLILENLRYIDNCGKAIEIRIPFVPDYNDGEIDAIGAFLRDFRHITKIRVLPYHNYAGSKYRALGLDSSLPPRLPTAEEIESARSRLRAYGLSVCSQ